MKKIELVYSYILEQAMEKKRTAMTQAEIAKARSISLSTVNAAINHLRKMNAVKVKLRSFDIVDAKKILYYWASIRNVGKDIAYATRVDATAAEIEKNMQPGVVYAAYSAYKIKFKDVPADYSEVYVWPRESAIGSGIFSLHNISAQIFPFKQETSRGTDKKYRVLLFCRFHTLF